MENGSGKRAWEELLRRGGGYTAIASDGSGTTGNRTVYKRGTTKLPSGGAGRVQLSDCLPAPLSDNFLHGIGFLHEQHIDLSLERAPAMDSLLARKGYDYGFCLGELWDAGVIEEADSSATSSVEGSGRDGYCGIFFVKRKDGLARLIFDPVHASALCQPPLHTSLPSAESISSLEVLGGFHSLRALACALVPVEY